MRANPRVLASSRSGWGKVLHIVVGASEVARKRLPDNRRGRIVRISLDHVVAELPQQFTRFLDRRPLRAPDACHQQGRQLGAQRDP